MGGSPSALLALFISILILAGCAGAPDPVAVAPQPEAERVVVEPEPETEPEPEVVPEPEPDAEPQTPVVPEPVVTKPIDVPEDLYQQAFEEVEAVINELNRVIASGEFETWTTYLTNRYADYYSHPKVLADLSRQPFLASNNIRLRSLEDYFADVVAPSRARARLDDLIFYTDSLVEAVTEFRGQRVILYLLRKVDGEWKIDTLEKLPTETSSKGSPGAGVERRLS